MSRQFVRKLGTIRTPFVIALRFAQRVGKGGGRFYSCDLAVPDVFVSWV